MCINHASLTTSTSPRGGGYDSMRGDLSNRLKRNTRGGALQDSRNQLKNSDIDT